MSLDRKEIRILLSGTRLTVFEFQKFKRLNTFKRDKRSLSLAAKINH